MLADLFKPAWKSSSVDKRLKAVAAMDSGFRTATDSGPTGQ